jgi:hypothetical protein
LAGLREWAFAGLHGASYSPAPAAPSIGQAYIADTVRRRLQASITFLRIHMEQSNAAGVRDLEGGKDCH